MAEPAALGGVMLDTVSVTATRTDEAVIDTLGGASVVTGEEIVRLQARNVSDLLRAIPGVTAQISQNDPQQSVNIRGLQDFGRVNVLIDGARQNFQISGHNANGGFYLDPAFLSQVDVVRGPIATIYGSGAIGGVVSLTTRGVDDILQPDERYGLEQTIGIGTNGASILGSTSAGVRIGTIVDLYGQIVYRNTNTYHDGAGDGVADSGSRIVGGLFKANIRPADGHTISLSALREAFDYTNNGTSGVGTRFRSDVDTGTYTLGYRFQSPDKPLIDLSAKVYFSTTQDEQTVVKPTATYAALGVKPGAKLSDTIETTGFDLFNTSRFSTSVVDHALTYGIDGVWDEVTTRDAAGGYVAAFTPSGDRQLFGGFVQDEARYGGWLRVLGALRYDTYALSGGGFSSDGSRLSPKITVGVTPLTGIEVYGTYAEGYRAPSVTETLISGTHPFPAFLILPNPGLRPEVGHTLEAGVNLKYDDVLVAGDRFRGKATVFRNDVDDYIDIGATGPSYLVPFIPGAPVNCGVTPFLCFPIQSQQYTNVARARLQGVELEGAYDWGRGFASINAQHIEGEDRDTGVPLSTVAPNRLGGTLGLRFLDERLTVGARGTLVSASSRRVSVPSKGYGLVDLFADYRYSDTTRATVTIDNLFDRRYTPFLASDAAPGLTAKVSLTMKLAAK